VDSMYRNERKREKETGRNTEWRRKRDKMDERDMEERKRNGWGIETTTCYKKWKRNDTS
jgi:hypothetical protein